MLLFKIHDLTSSRKLFRLLIRGTDEQVLSPFKVLLFTARMSTINAPLGSPCHAGHCCCSSQTSYLCGIIERFCSFEICIEPSITKLTFRQDTFRMPWHSSLTGHDSHAIQLHQLGRELLGQIRKFQLK